MRGSSAATGPSGAEHGHAPGEEFAAGPDLLICVSLIASVLASVCGTSLLEIDELSSQVSSPDARYHHRNPG